MGEFKWDRLIYISQKENNWDNTFLGGMPGGAQGLLLILHSRVSSSRYEELYGMLGRLNPCQLHVRQVPYPLYYHADLATIFLC